MKIKKYYRWGKFYFTNIPFYIIFYITSKCNAKCVHCFNWRIVKDHSKRKELTLDEIKLIAKNWGEILIINLAGGEPYLRDDIPEIVDIFKKYTNVEIIAIPSNGFLTNRIVENISKLLYDFPDIFFRFTFSIDGIGEEHDKIRGISGSFVKVFNTIKEVTKLKQKHNNFSVFTNSCFMYMNQDNLINTLKFIKKELNVDASSVTFIRGDTRVPETQKNLYIEKYKETIDYLSRQDNDKLRNHPLTHFISGATKYARQKVYENLKTDKRNFECFAIKKMIVLDDTGEVQVCEILLTSLGNLRDYNYDIKRIVTSDFAKSEFKKIKRHDCNCTWECAVRTGIMYNPKEYLSIFKN